MKRTTLIALALLAPLLMPAIDANASDGSSTPGDKGERLEQLMEKTRASYKIPALAVAVITSEAVLERRVVGVRDLNTLDPAHTTDRFHLGSNTKNVTSFVAARMVEQDMIGWDTEFFELFPTLKSEARPCYHSITLQDLLSHRALVQPHSFGGSYQDLPKLEGDLHRQRVGYARYVLSEKPKKPVFAKFKYSNAGYVLAAVMLEEASGKTWEELVDQIMNDDLGLEVGFGWPIKYGSDQPRGHIPGLWAGQGGLALTPYEYSSSYMDERLTAPAGDLNVSIENYARYVRMHLRGLRGEGDYLTAATYQFLHWGRPDYSMGWRNESKKGAEVSWHDGSAGTFFSHVYILEDRDLAVAVLANSGVMDLKTVAGVYGLRDKIVDLYAE